MAYWICNTKLEQASLRFGPNTRPTDLPKGKWVVIPQEFYEQNKDDWKMKDRGFEMRVDPVKKIPRMDEEDPARKPGRKEKGE